MHQERINLYLNEGKSQWEVKDNKLEGNSFKDRAEERDAEMVHFILWKNDSNHLRFEQLQPRILS